ncbi:formylglycine-generating enzyme family protein, partial [Candidatus Venteria ishoeyi]|uniref:formylglycine-generating enzyme family protein n=1 Tax=Candidatus Venteria ishoeyi TaxID=1899563 RepID=UPI000AA119EC
FIRRLNAKEGCNNCYRLPTEAEWEYAARAGTTTKYHFGDSGNQLGNYAWYGASYDEGNSRRESHPVGQKRPNPWGLYDILGNVREWVEDCYHHNYTGAPKDGSAWTSSCYKHDNNTVPRIMRGCAMVNNVYSCRISYRLLSAPSYKKGIDHGFRLTRKADKR